MAILCSATSAPTAGPTDDFVFWFYTLNGEAGTVSEQNGAIQASFADYQLASGDTVFWQLIAPDKAYGFKPCPPHQSNATK